MLSVDAVIFLNLPLTPLVMTPIQVSAMAMAMFLALVLVSCSLSVVMAAAPLSGAPGVVAMCGLDGGVATATPVYGVNPFLTAQYVANSSVAFASAICQPLSTTSGGTTTVTTGAAQCTVSSFSVLSNVSWLNVDSHFVRVTL